MLVEGKALTRVYSEFKRVDGEAGDGLSLIEFVTAFLDGAGTGVDATTTVKLLIDLFQQMDINGDHKTEWSEFISFCIDAGMAAAASFPRPDFSFLYDARFEDRLTASPVMLQVSYFKYTKRRYGEGRRLFKMAPLHHHFEKSGWKETQVVVRFWIITMLLCLVGLSTLKLR